ncbi:MAG TPA: hypothetical protein VK524_02255 [Polyangiaceae bacterium]|nr:hypothetical protein [Polyangiaceae bacterium]
MKIALASALLLAIVTSCLSNARNASLPPVVQASRPASPAIDSVRGSPWSSAEACASALRRGERARRGAGRARIGTWNIRWFPDGRPGKRASRAALDVSWIACAIAWLDVDVLVVQEFKTLPRARERTAEILQQLDRFTGGRWHAEFDSCPRPAGQHVGLFFNARRVTAQSFRLYGSINPHGEACRDQLRPGFGAYLRFEGGLDLHLTAVHLKSGPKRRDFELRRRSFAGLGAALASSQASRADADVLFAGDFNSMGCSKCSPRVSARDELAHVDGELSSLNPPLRRIASGRECSHYFGTRPTLLDFFVAASLAELPEDRAAEVYGPCADFACENLDRDRAPSAFSAALSDHCPVVIELDEQDKD